MKQTWRWFGPDDLVTLPHVRQAGATGVVSALHHMNQGNVWPIAELEKRKAEIEAAGMVWSVVESIAVHEDIKTRSGNFQDKIEAYKQSIRNLGAVGIKTLCYNFMAVTDWTRTDLFYPMPHGGSALRFDVDEFCAYDVFILQRPNAENDYTPERVAAAKDLLARLTDEDKARIERNLIDWVPARDFVYDRESFRKVLARYDEMGVEDMRNNLFAFIGEILPVAEEAGVKLAIHPDDPPFSLFGLPRVMSTASDARSLLTKHPSMNNGLTLCTGSYGARPDNDLPAMAREFGPRVHFAHLRNTTHEGNGSFHESEHLEGNTDMVAVVAALLDEEDRRKAEGRADWEIPMRPDHGHAILDDIGKPVNPGYSAIGRLKGLAELRGIMVTLRHKLVHSA